ncbi:MAG: hypothetical protein M0R37_14570, partial [Bacteroidales bacterium]|nr:hypothetical protein [Bacteroidales bacterium]
KDTAASTFESLKERGGVLKETFQQVAEGEINPLRGAVRAVGTGIGAVNDVAAGAAVGAVKAITPASVEQKAGQAVTGFLSTNVGKAGLSAVQSGLEAYEKWKSNNEEAAKDLEAVVNIAEIFPVGKGVVGAGEIATKVVETISAGVKAKKAVSAAKDVQRLQELLSPVETKAMKEAAVREGRTTASGLLSKSKIIPSDETKMLAEEMVGLVDPKKSIAENVKVIDKEVTSLAQNLEKTLAGNKKGFNLQQAENYIRSVVEEKPLMFISETAEGSAYNKVVDTALDIIKKHPQNAEGLWAARKEFDAVAEAMTGAFKKTAQGDLNATNASQAVRNVRRKMNELISELSGNPEFKESMKRMSNLYDAMEVLSEKGAGTIGKSKIGEFMAKHPAWKAAAIGGATLGVGATIPTIAASALRD